MSLLAEFGATNLTLGTIVALFVLAILRGWLVPRKTLEDQRTDYEARIRELTTSHDSRLGDARSDLADWRETARLSDARADTAVEQTSALLRANRATEYLVRELGKVTGVEVPDGQ